MPYLQNFILHSAATEKATMSEAVANTDNSAWTRAQRKAARKGEEEGRIDILRLTSYAIRSVNRIDAAAAAAAAAASSSGGDGSNSNEKVRRATATTLSEYYDNDGDEEDAILAFQGDIQTTHNGFFTGKINRDLCGCVLGRGKVSFRVYLPTGSIYNFTVGYVLSYSTLPCFVTTTTISIPFLFLSLLL